MDKQIKLTKITKFLFVFNIIVLLSMLYFRYLYTSLVYYPTIVNIFFILNILLLLFGIFSNIITIKYQDLYDNLKYYIIVILVLITYILFNTLGIYLINKPIDNKYKGVSKNFQEYCNHYSCETYETKYYNKNRIFHLKKQYLDYNNNANYIDIKTFYNENRVYKIESVIYSDSSLFSEHLIKEELDKYLGNFNIELDEILINKAFENRFKGSIKEANYVYKVTEIYENKKLKELKTKIIINFN